MLKELNQVIEYIEEHLTEDLSLENIAKYAGVSDYHFRTVFFHLSGMTLNEYVKNRKLRQIKVAPLVNEPGATFRMFRPLVYMLLHI